MSFPSLMINIFKVVAETRGNEEYVHLKSLEDEYEYMESNMPQKQAPPEEEEGPQLSPNPAVQDPTEGFVEEPEDGAGSPLGLNPENWSGKYPNSENGRKGYSGEDDNEDLSPPLSSTSYAGKKGNRWSSFGTEGNDWIPPPRNHSSELPEEELGGEDRDDYVPAGKRRPDLFDSSPLASSNEYFATRGRDDDERKSNQFEEEEDETHNYKFARESEEGSPFQFYGKTGGNRGSREELKGWGSEDDID